MCRPLVVFRLLAATLLVVFTTAARAAPVQGVDCDCTKEGAYNPPVLPRLPVVPEFEDDQGLSGPAGKYVVLAGNGAFSVVRARDGAVVIPIVQAESLGFSPDEDRAVAVSRASGIVTAYLYDLTSSTPPVPVLTRTFTDGGFFFSPNGAYVIDAHINHDPINPNLDVFSLTVFEPVTATQIYFDEFGFSPPLGVTPNILRAIFAGFSPDERYRSLVYLYVNTLGQRAWTLVNLEERRHISRQTNLDFAWSFSRCGDRLGLDSVNQLNSWFELDLYDTDTCELAGSTTTPLTTPILNFRASPAEGHVMSVLSAPSIVLDEYSSDEECQGSSGELPQAAFSAPSSTFRGVPVTFTDQSTTRTGRIVSWEWDFGDGGRAGGERPTHSFALTGSFEVSLTVTNSESKSASVTHTIVVNANQPPVASFTFAPQYPSVHEPITLTDTSTDGDDGIASRSWPDRVVTMEGCPPELNVVLTVYDHAGQSATASQAIPIGGQLGLAPPPGSNLADVVKHLCAGEAITLAEGHYGGGAEIRYELAGAGPGRTFIDGYGDPEESHGYVLRLVLGGQVSGVTLSGGGYTTSGTGLLAGGGVRAFDGTLSNVEITGNLAGVAVENNFSVAIHDSFIHHNALSAVGSSCCAHVDMDHVEVAFNGGGIGLMEASTTNFTSNDVHDNGYGFIIQNGIPSLIAGNRFRRNRSGDGSPVVVLGGPATFAGNLVAGNDAGGVYAEGPNIYHRDRATIVNSTIVDNCGDGISGDAELVANNIVAGNFVDFSGVAQTAAQNLIGVDARFLAASDYHLAADSPAIGAGDPAYLPAALVFDGDGDARSIDGLDIGWDEWQPGRTPEATEPLACSEPHGGTGGGGAGGTGTTGGTSGEAGAGATNTGSGGEPGGGSAGEPDSAGGTPAQAGTTSGGGDDHPQAGDSPDGGTGEESGGTGGRAASGGTSGRGGNGGTAGNPSAGGGGTPPGPRPRPRGCSIGFGDREPGSANAWGLLSAMAGLIVARRRRSGGFRRSRGERTR